MNRYPVVLLLSVIAAVLLSPPDEALPAEKFPVKPITALVGFPPGGSTDLIARALEGVVKKYLGQPVVVLNKTGGVGTIAVTELVKARADGYTVCVCPVGPLTTQPHLADLPYTEKDYLPVIHIAKFVGVLSVRADAPWKAVQEFLAHIRAQPGTVKISHAGVGTVNHLGMEELKMVAKLDVTLVPSGGGGPAVVSMLGGHVEASVHNTNEIIAQVEAKKARVLGVFDERRNPKFPDAPTFREIGYDVQVPNFYIIAVPKGTPPEIMKTLHDAFKKAMEDPAFAATAEKLVFDLEYLGPDDAARKLAQTYARNGELIRRLGLPKRK
ncbi:MAG: tripartite tricarboxylate transporter substrate binding protein [Candidatus Rokubacteria bacterium]|nr:tripartite tricarboxylate transporter substrate binding protein [Candidatus Rokubacteria bacterium]